MRRDPAAAARALSFMFFDVDGVMTDGGLYYDAAGEALKRFHVLDGHGLKALQAAGVGVGILSGRSHTAVVHRARELGISHVLLGCDDKLAAFHHWLNDNGMSASACGHMGDDLADLPVMAEVSLAASVCNGHADVLAQADWVSTKPGGEGAVRELCDFILKARAT
jgi:3-deoxy-D-manno-octulosonate 8-phosphate phosphatase (KDO 8-P phosphatase)